ncbi:restriction endonuclease [Brevundimonas diminuta]|uniref:ABC-three component system protein n=1 Tax=Brevundimonas diminuta TaxID=293 RepID=UPI002096F4C3|nr:ABC-three component system protein [Brevundimonas diminuta]MCO8018222.1 restriction endonuclease [Brevundimonas diminuta]MCO8022254.1 restriction endonuclease [Brevundimonas diminuta]
MPDVLPADSIEAASSVHPLDRLKIMPPGEWERFVWEWVYELKTKYIGVERSGGSGDLGCDVIAVVSGAIWHNYQCKHYDHPLTPSDVWSELGKHIYHAQQGSFSPAQKYFFVAPQGVGTKLGALLRDPARLKEELKDNWQKYCVGKISTSDKTPLEGPLLAYLESFDFSIFGYVTQLKLIEGHKTSPYHSLRFGFQLAPRPPSPVPSATISKDESVYVEKVCDAYSEAVGYAVTSDTLPAQHERHFSRVRQAFFSAEELRSLYEEAVPKGTFDSLKQEIFDAVELTATLPHSTGLGKLAATVQHATQAQITNSPLLPRMRMIDRHGICHQLANDDLLTWVDK